MNDDITTEDVRETFSYGYWLKNGRTNQATEDSLEAFDAWLEEVKSDAYWEGCRDGYNDRGRAL